MSVFELLMALVVILLCCYYYIVIILYWNLYKAGTIGAWNKKARFMKITP